MDERRRDGFFVGYLKYPRGVAPLAIAASLALILLALAGGFLWAGTARDPGNGDWGTEVVTIEGIVEGLPFPVLRNASLDGETLGTVFLVSTGKLGAQDRLGDADGQPARAKGLLVRRGAVSLLALIDGQRAIERIEGDYIKLGPPYAIEGEGPRTLHGEIIDPKCYLGVMRPALGRQHRGCTELCLIGGIPPFLLTRSPEGAEHVFLLVSPDGSALPWDLPASLSGRPVSVTGSLMHWGDLTVFAAAPDKIVTLTP